MPNFMNDAPEGAEKTNGNFDLISEFNHSPEYLSAVGKSEKVGDQKSS
jgi:hypothetical protein